MATALFAREKLIATARSLPAAPQVLTELGQLLQDINVELDQIADLLKRDAALAARIIRISNSTVFGGSGRIAAIEEAVNRVSAATGRAPIQVCHSMGGLAARAWLRAGGTGAAELRARRCTGCGLELDMSELKKHATASPDLVLRCEECGRILVRTEQSGLT